MKTHPIVYQQSVIRLKPEAEAELRERLRRINDPQDLEDGLLAAQHEEMCACFEKHLQETMEMRIWSNVIWAKIDAAFDPK